MEEQNKNIIIYQSENGKAHLQVRLKNQTMWLSANQMADLFGRDEKTLRKHINNVFSEGELIKENNTQFLLVDGVKQPVAFYSLDTIISVGYRVNCVTRSGYAKSHRGISKMAEQYIVPSRASIYRYNQSPKRKREKEYKITYHYVQRSHTGGCDNAAF